MALERLIDGKGKAAKYSSDLFYDQFRMAQELPNINITSKDGLEQFEKITGYKELSGKLPEDAQYEFNAIVAGQGEDIQRYAASNFDGLFKELPEEEQKFTAFDMTPEKSYVAEGIDPSEDKYEICRKKLREYTATIEAIDPQRGGDPQKYLTNKVKELEKTVAGSYIARAIAQDQQKYLDLQLRTSTALAFRELDKYGGAYKFASDTKKRVTPLIDKVNAKKAEINQKIQEEKRNIDPSTITSQKDLAVAFSKIDGKYQKQLQDLSEKNPDADRVASFVQGGLMKDAYKAIAQKKAVAEAKKKAEEAALAQAA